MSIDASGVLIYETYAEGNARFGNPSNPDFLLRPGELLQLAVDHGLQVVAYENGFCSAPERCIQRMVAVRPSANVAHPQRQLKSVACKEFP